jgi:hypothetical protein
MIDFFNRMFLMLLMCLFSTISFSQDSIKKDIPFNPDRPGIGTPPDIVRQGHVHFESGYQYGYRENGSEKTTNNIYNSTLIRIGLAKNFELRMEADYSELKTNNIKESHSYTGFNNLMVGSKIFLSEQNRFLPKTSLLMSFTFPNSNLDEFTTTYLAPSLTLLMQNSLHEYVSLGYNLGLIWDGVQAEPGGFYAVSIDIDLPFKVEIFMEGYGYFYSNSPNEHKMDLGLTWRRLKNLQFDVSGGMSITNKSPDYFVACGFAARLP